METLTVQNVSQAQAAQRAGRAGRVQAGMCFRLCTEDAFSELAPCGVPEILRVSLSQVVLQLKGTHFDFVTQPDKATLVRAVRLLYALRALDGDRAVWNLQLTERSSPCLPLDPVFGHLLLQSAECACMKEMLTAVAVLSAEYLFYHPNNQSAAKAAAAHRHFCKS